MLFNMDHRNNGALAGVRPMPQKNNIAAGDSLFSNNRMVYKKNPTIPTNVRKDNGYKCASQRIAERRAKAVGKSSMKVGLPTTDLLSLGNGHNKNQNLNTINSARRRVRSGGCVAPKKKGAIKVPNVPIPECPTHEDESHEHWDLYKTHIIEYNRSHYFYNSAHFDEIKQGNSLRYCKLTDQGTIGWKTFAINMDKIISQNSIPNRSWTAGINKFTDQPKGPPTGLNTNMSESNNNSNNANKDTSTVPILRTSSPLDYVEKGCVTDVKDQGSSESCWSFAGIGVAEGYYAGCGKANTDGQYGLTQFSEQNILDCCTTDCPSMTSDGAGIPYEALDWIIDNTGVCMEEDYNYTGYSANSSCSSTCTSTWCSPPSSLSVQKDIPSDDDELMTALDKYGPIAVAVDSSKLSSYSSGILSGCVNDDAYLNHAMLLVGYGTDSGTKYWKVKNSWGSDWGKDGYIQFKRNESCLLTKYTSYITG
jgi:C1A family cysteine protease